MRELFRILLPLLVWLASFSAIYGLHGLSCANDWTEVLGLGISAFRSALLIAWSAAISLQLLLLWAAWKQTFSKPPHFYWKVDLATAWSGLVATLWTLFPIAVTSTCN